MNPEHRLLEARTRRYFLQNSCLGLGGIALGALAQASPSAGSVPFFPSVIL